MCLSILLRKPSNCNAFNKNDSREVTVRFFSRFTISRQAYRKQPKNKHLTTTCVPPQKKKKKQICRIEVNGFVLRIPFFSVKKVNSFYIFLIF